MQHLQLVLMFKKRIISKSLRNKFVLMCIINIFSCVILVKYFIVNQVSIKIDRHMKYILLWPPVDANPFYLFSLGQRTIHRCPVNTCHFTDNINLFGGELKYFDAILFNPNNGDGWYVNNLPKQRFSHQKYVFVAAESAFNYPICTTIFENFFNWTWTYRLDSDCILRYFTIRNKQGEVVGPKNNMSWDDMRDVNDETVYFDLRNVSQNLREKIKTKNKAAAWFVSNCVALSPRRKMVHELQHALKKYNLTVDIYGQCGILKCPKLPSEACDEMLEREYYFYMALENSVSEDYVTEKILHGTQHAVIPVVLGGAFYDKFLPPNSYLDFQKQSPEELAHTMNHLIKNTGLYSRYLKWTSYYEYVHDGFFVSLCEFCARLNDKSKTQEFSVYENFRDWWNPHYKGKICST